MNRRPLINPFDPINVAKRTAALAKVGNEPEKKAVWEELQDRQANGEILTVAQADYLRNATRKFR